MMTLLSNWHEGALMALVKCLYCDTTNDALQTSGFCDSCGKKLPSSALVKTRRSLAEHEAGEGSEVRRQVLSPASEALLTAAVVHLVVGGMFLMVGPLLISPVPQQFFVIVLAWSIVPSLAVGLFGGLARWQPRPAAALAILAVLAWVAGTFALAPAVALPWLMVEAVMLGLVGRAVYVAFR